jgi:serine/threonine protein kinase
MVTYIKLQNILIRVTECTHTSVNSIQLVLADFDCATSYDRDISKQTGEFNRGAQNGTSGFHPSLYVHTIPYDQVAYDCLRHTQRPRTRMNIVSAYSPPYAHPHTDIFSLGICFLALVHRCDYSYPWYIFVKREMEKCNAYSKRCSPAHVLLHHPLPIVNPTIQENKRTSYDLFTVLTQKSVYYDEGVGLARYATVLQLRASKRIDDDIYDLVERMTSDIQMFTVINIHQCLTILQKCIALNKFI